MVPRDANKIVPTRDGKEDQPANPTAYSPQYGTPYIGSVHPWLNPVGAPCNAPPWGDWPSTLDDDPAHVQHVATDPQTSSPVPVFSRTGHGPFRLPCVMALDYLSRGTAQDVAFIQPKTECERLGCQGSRWVEVGGDFFGATPTLPVLCKPVCPWCPLPS